MVNLLKSRSEELPAGERPPGKRNDYEIAGCNECRSSTARLACDAAVKIARLSCFKTLSQWSM
jgi:hypothetical protein